MVELKYVVCQGGFSEAETLNRTMVELKYGWGVCEVGEEKLLIAQWLN